MGPARWEAPREFDDFHPRAARSVGVRAHDPDRPADRETRLGLSFVVTLTNPTGRPVALDPCPNYLISVSLKIVGVGSHQLDCTDGQGRTRIIAAGASLSFAMRLPLALDQMITPGPAQIGPTQLTWSMGVTSATVTITVLA